jgi:hypothetical protein
MIDAITVPCHTCPVIIGLEARHDLVVSQLALVTDSDDTHGFS